MHQINPNDPLVQQHARDLGRDVRATGLATYGGEPDEGIMDDNGGKSICY